jgi:(heptosyl)LPS beta-1,4-glucosyltransferase
MNISVIIHTKNSAKTLRAALESVEFADEIVVIDAESSDETVAIAKEFTDRIFTVEKADYVEPVRNFGISKASRKWLLLLDADEEIPHSLAKKLPELMEKEADVWRLPRKNLIFGFWPKHASWWPDYVVRFFKKGQVRWRAEIHSQPKTLGKVADLEPREEWAIIHHNYTNISEYIGRLNHYTSITAQEKTRRSQPALEAFFSDFFRKFFLMKSYRDGVVGLHVSILQAMYEAAVAMKLWEKAGKKNRPVAVDEMMKKLIGEMAYWRAEHQVQTQRHALPRLFWRVRRKLKV